jgi:hypothetical protein
MSPAPPEAQFVMVKVPSAAMGNVLPTFGLEPQYTLPAVLMYMQTCNTEE